MDDAQGFEVALGAVESESEAALKAAASVARELKKAKAAAATGQARDLRRALEAAEGLAAQLAETARTLRGNYDVDETAQGDVLWQGRKPVFSRLVLALRPLDQQPFLRPRFSQPIISMRDANTHPSKPRG